MNRIFLGALGAIILILLFWGGCNHAKVGRLEKENAALKNQPSAKPVVKVERDTVRHDTTIYRTAYVPKVSYRDTGRTRYVRYEVPGPTRYIDTTNCRGWVAYRDSLTIPMDGGHLVLHDTIVQNAIAVRRPVWHLKQRTITERHTIAEKRRQLWVGIGGAYAMRDSAMSVGPSLMYLTKRGLAYEVGVQADTRGRLTYSAGAKFLISSRKK